MIKNFYRLFSVFPRLAVKLSGGRLYNAVFLYMQLAYCSVLWRLGRNKTVAFNIQYNETEATLYLQDSTDIASLEEIYINGEYTWNLSFSPETILDLGANYGDTALYYHMCYPQATIIAVEASLDSYSRLCTHVKGISKIVPIHAAVSDTNGEVDLFMMEESNLGHSLLMRSVNMKKTTVPAMTLVTLAEKYNQGKRFDLVKFDIEGAEEKMFKNVQPQELGKAYIGEIHYDLVNLNPSDVTQLFTGSDLETKKLNSSDRVIIRSIFE